MCLACSVPHRPSSSDVADYLDRLRLVVAFCQECSWWFPSAVIWDAFHRISKIDAHRRKVRHETGDLWGQAIGHRLSVLEWASVCMDDWPRNLQKILRACAASEYTSYVPNSWPDPPNGRKPRNPMKRRQACESFWVEDRSACSNDLVGNAFYISLRKLYGVIDEAWRSLYGRFAVDELPPITIRRLYVEVKLAQAVASGVRQYVMFGAGLNSFAYRDINEALKDLKVIEIDYCAIQEWKKRLIEWSGWWASKTLTYVPFELCNGNLNRLHEISGLDHSLPTFFSALGFVTYITLPVFRAIVALVASFPAGSGIALDYELPPDVGPPRPGDCGGEMRKLLFEPKDMAWELRRFHEIEDLGHRELNAGSLLFPGSPIHPADASKRVVSAWR
jgi:O-methyltransferase involved in polyketide biosynthesis